MRQRNFGFIFTNSFLCIQLRKISSNYAPQVLHNKSDIIKSSELFSLMTIVAFCLLYMQLIQWTIHRTFNRHWRVIWSLWGWVNWAQCLFSKQSLNGQARLSLNLPSLTRYTKEQSFFDCETRPKLVFCS